MQKFLEKIKDPSRLKAVVALSLGGLSLIVLLVAFQLNFQQNQLYTQVTRMNDSGEQELMIFRDYRNLQVENVKKMLKDCLERNELFGDGTGEVCEVHRQQLACVSDAMSQEDVQTCVKE